jgi:hypothetical protein
LCPIEHQIPATRGAVQRQPEFKVSPEQEAIIKIYA